MPYKVSFISLGCAKNQVNCEQMMAAVQAAGHTIQADPAGADVAVVNTCGFLASACEEAIDNILEMAELKRAGQVQKILVTGCMAHRGKGGLVGAAEGTGPVLRQRRKGRAFPRLIVDVAANRAFPLAHLLASFSSM